jgi:hypothetical protein
MLASSAPLDQFIVQHPDYFFWALARTIVCSTLQPGNLGESLEMRNIRAADRG